MMPSVDDASFCTRKVVLPIVSPSPLLLLEPPGLQHLLTGANAQPDTAPSNSASSWWAEATGAWQHAFPCDLCGVVFARESGLAQHKVRHLHLFALNSAVGVPSAARDESLFDADFLLWLLRTTLAGCASSSSTGCCDTLPCPFDL